MTATRTSFVDTFVISLLQIVIGADRCVNTNE